MAFLRYASRSVHHTVADYVTEQLETLGWMDPAATPFGAAVVRAMRTPAIIGEKLIDSQIGPGTLAITIGDEFPPEMQELGGPTSVQSYPIFFDVLQDSDAAAINLATDIKDILLGRLPDTRRWLDVVDKITGSAAPGWKIELDDITRVRPDTTLPYHWQVVKATAEVYFPEEVY